MDVGLCHICGKVATVKCSMCGRMVCDAHFDKKTGVCISCSVGKRMKEG